MRNLAIVDVQTLFLASREEYGPLARIDYVKLRSLLKQDTLDITDAVAYILASPYHDDRRFIRFLKKHGYILIRKFAQLDIPRVASPANDTEESIKFKNRSWIDSMVWESIKMLPRYDHIYIVSGNGQFCTVVDAAHKNGKKVTVVSFKGSLQKELAAMADNLITLDDKYIFDSSAFIKE